MELIFAIKDQSNVYTSSRFKVPEPNWVLAYLIVEKFALHT